MRHLAKILGVTLLLSVLALVVTSALASKSPLDLSKVLVGTVVLAVLGGVYVAERDSLATGLVTTALLPALLSYSPQPLTPVRILAAATGLVLAALLDRSAVLSLSVLSAFAVGLLASRRMADLCILLAIYGATAILLAFLRTWILPSP